MKKILMVDDSETVRRQVRRALAPHGFELIDAVDGLDGLEKLRANPDLAVVLCDVNMPRMTGLELLSAARTERLTTPVIMLTSEGQPSLIRKAREFGAKGWIIKPFNVELLISAINKIAEMARTDAPQGDVSKR